MKPIVEKIHSLIILSGLLMLLFYSPSLAQEVNYDNSSLVIVKAPDLTSKQYGDFSSAIAPDNRYSMEYTCLESGIIVLRYYHNFSEKGDVRMAIQSALRQKGKLTRLEVIYVDITRQTSAQC
ncbi:MAG: hypothetical protein ACFB15_14325 [Cyclobacteriaceae bacterium]